MTVATFAEAVIILAAGIAADLIKECGGLPLALSMVGAMVRGKLPASWKSVLDHLRKADLDKIRAQFPDYPYTDVVRAIQVSVDLLDPTARQRYIVLAVPLEEMTAAPPLQQCIWGIDENEGAETGLSLAQREPPEGSIRLHDLHVRRSPYSPQIERENRALAQVAKERVHPTGNAAFLGGS
jgi:hypothetical protein